MTDYWWLIIDDWLFTHYIFQRCSSSYASCWLLIIREFIMRVTPTNISAFLVFRLFTHVSIFSRRCEQGTGSVHRLRVQAPFTGSRPILCYVVLAWLWCCLPHYSSPIKATCTKSANLCANSEVSFTECLFISIYNERSFLLYCSNSSSDITEDTNLL